MGEVVDHPSCESGVGVFAMIVRSGHAGICLLS